jgi:hypothetical protein
MSEEQGNERLKKLAKAIDELVEIGEDIAKDGIGADDVMHLPKLVSPAKDIYECIKEIKELGAEAKDLDWNEFGEILAEFNN